jgi:hypothetical protein
MDNWWVQEENKIAEIRCDDSGVEDLYGVQENGKWVYAIVSWWHHIPSIKLLFSDGKILAVD